MQVFARLILLWLLKRIFAARFYDLRARTAHFLLPWPLKIVVDHVILASPLRSGAGFWLHGTGDVLSGGQNSPRDHVVDFGGWVMMVILMGATPNRGAGECAGAAADLLAPQLPNSGARYRDTDRKRSERCGQRIGGILGILDFNVHIRLSQSIHCCVRSLPSIKSLP